MLIITEISNEARNELTIYGISCHIMSKCHNILPTRTCFFISSAGKIENVQEFKLKLFEYLFTDDSRIKIVWLYVVVLTEHDLLHF